MATKTFKDHHTAITYHLKNIEAIPVKVMEKLVIAFISDTNDQFVPELTGQLKNSAFIYSDYQRGIVVWATPYARERFYEGSRTGVAYWTIFNQETNGDKYKQMLIDEIKKGT